MANLRTKLKPRRRWIQVSLRTAFVLVTMLCLALSAWVAPAERRRRAMAIVEARGGRATYAGTYPEGSFFMAHLQRWLPRAYFDTVDGINLRRSKVTDADLAQISTLATLRSLAIDETQITDAGLAQVHRLKNLERLTFSHTSATLAGRARLQRELPNCRVSGP